MNSLAKASVVAGVAAFYMRSAQRERSRRGRALDECAVRRAAEAFYAALEAVFRGDAGAMTDVWAHSDQVTLFGYSAGYQAGWWAVKSRFEAVASESGGGHVDLRDFSIHVSDGAAWVVGREVGEVLRKSGESVKVNVRATSVFRSVAGRWKMVHHHADPLAAMVAKEWVPPVV